MAGTVKKFSLDAGALDILMPMSVVISRTGHIIHVAPSVAKLTPDIDMIGKRFLEMFAILRPRKKIGNISEFRGLTGAKLRLSLRTGPPITMKGVLVADPVSNHVLINMSFGYQLVDAVRQYGLSNGDFAKTDLAIEMLYLIEAKTAVMEQTRLLNQRLHSARLAAEKQASTDALTGLKNRRAMDDVLLSIAASGASFGLMHVDLDYFKNVNDTLGHAAGDHVLQAAANILVEETRDCDTVARVGGDEFVLVFENLTDGPQLTRIATRIVNRLEVPVDFEGKTCRISGSIGFTTSDFYETPDLDQMLSDADVALYASKHKGRACTTMVTKDLLARAAKAREASQDSGAPVAAQQITK